MSDGGGVLLRGVPQGACAATMPRSTFDIAGAVVAGGGIGQYLTQYIRLPHSTHCCAAHLNQRTFTKFHSAQRRPLLGPSPKNLLRHYVMQC